MRRSSAAALCAAGVFAAAPASGDETTRERAARVHASAIVVDGHNDLTTFLITGSIIAVFILIRIIKRNSFKKRHGLSNKRINYYW